MSTKNIGRYHRSKMTAMLLVVSMILDINQPFGIAVSKV